MDQLPDFWLAGYVPVSVASFRSTNRSQLRADEFTRMPESGESVVR